eukprot:scaffold1771_cov211-Alexandrium_tamarense.AAC.5
MADKESAVSVGDIVDWKAEGMVVVLLDYFGARETNCELFECWGERGPVDSKRALMAKPVVGELDKNYGSRYA